MGEHQSDNLNGAERAGRPLVNGGYVETSHAAWREFEPALDAAIADLQRQAQVLINIRASLRSAFDGKPLTGMAQLTAALQLSEGASGSP